MLSFCLILSAGYVATGQSSEAKSLLSTTIEKMKAAEGYQGSFSMKIFFGNELEHEEKGEILTWGKSIKLDLGDYQYIADGKSSWTYLKERNEVQINDVTEDDFSMYNPLVLLDHFFEGGFDYDIVDKYPKDGKSYSKLDIKPQDHNSEYAKVSVVISTDNHLPTSFVLIQKDGVRYDIDINDIKVTTKAEVGQFNFNAANYPGVIVEDLRLGE
jgi:outer membrane lipoprotein-sorting protein